MTSLGPHSCLHTHSVLPSGASCKPAHLSAKRTESHFTSERAECLLFPSTLIFKTANREQQLALHHSYVIYQQAHMVPTHLNATCCQLNRGFLFNSHTFSSRRFSNHFSRHFKCFSGETLVFPAAHERRSALRQLTITNPPIINHTH